MDSDGFYQALKPTEDSTKEMVDSAEYYLQLKKAAHGAARKKTEQQYSEMLGGDDD